MLIKTKIKYGIKSDSKPEYNLIFDYSYKYITIYCLYTMTYVII